MIEGKLFVEENSEIKKCHPPAGFSHLRDFVVITGNSIGRQMKGSFAITPLTFVQFFRYKILRNIHG